MTHDRNPSRWVTQKETRDEAAVRLARDIRESMGVATPEDEWRLWIQDRMRAYGVKQIDLADAAKMNRTSLNKWLNGNQQLTGARISKLMLLLGYRLPTARRVNRLADAIKHMAQTRNV